MSNPTFTTAATAAPPPDPSKHVNYTQGMVLGVDDFQQEFAYLSNRDQWLARDAIGYGTLCGLHVVLEPDQNNISVSPGVALNPRGQLIRVAPRQCAKLDAWFALDSTKTRMNELGLTGTGPLRAYVVLCYRDCPVDNVPVPGEPCRCDSDTMAASRIIDDFRLEITLTPPPQTEEDVIRDFVTWLRGIEVVDFEPGADELGFFLQAIRDAFGCGDSPPQSPPESFFESPPAGLRMPRRFLCEWMRAVLKLWTTELRPCWQAQCAPKKTCACCGPCGCHGSGAEPEEMACDCLLLAEIDITRSGGGSITGAVLNEERRPYLVHLRMLQELLLCGPCCGEGCGDCRTFATVIALDQDTLQIWIHHPNALDLPEDAVTLQIGGSTITDFTITPAMLPPGLNLFDLTLSGSPLAAIGNLATLELWFDATLIHEPDGRTLADAIWQEKYCYGDYVEPRLTVFGSAGSVTLGGDVVGPPAHNHLTAIQGKPLDLTGLTDKRVLGFDANTWHPVPLPQRADNAHLPAPEHFGDGALVGTPNDFYARADHRHAMPADPVPPHVANTTAHLAHQIQGDVIGKIGATVVAGLQKVPVANTAPSKDDVLQFDDATKSWTPKQIQTGATGEFVEHPPDAGPYLIVAAGRFQLPRNNQPFGPVGPTYNNLRATQASPTTFNLTFGKASGGPIDRYRPPTGKFNYIVKGTALGKNPGFLHVVAFSDDIVINVAQPNKEAVEGFMVEISLFGKF